MSATARRPNVLVVISDAMRADRLHCYGNHWATSPAIDRLAAEGVLFKWAIAHSAHTMPCVVSAFTGLDPLAHGLVDPRTHGKHSWRGWKTPFDLLEQAGYAVGGQDDWVYYHLGRRHRPKEPADFHAFMDKHHSDGFFLWNMPDNCHLPYKPPPPYDTAFLPPDHVTSDESRERLEIVKTRMIVHKPGLVSQHELDEKTGVDTHSGGIDRDIAYTRSAASLALEPEDRVPIVALYDGQVRSIDDQVAAHVAALERLGILDDTVVVITADHGEELMERGSVGHTSCSLMGTLYDECIRVPLIIRYPRGLPKGVVVERQVSQIDIMHTLFDLLGLRMPPESQGRSLVPLAHGRAADFVEETYATTIPCGWQVLDDDRRVYWCLRTPRWKLHYYDMAGRGENCYELFDLAADPGEKTNLIARRPDAAEGMKAKLHAWMSGPTSRFIA